MLKKWWLFALVWLFLIIVIHLVFLSGTFFSIQALPESLKFLFLYNPYYYVVNFFRSSFYSEYEFKIYENLFILIFVFLSVLTTGIIFFKGYRVIK